MLVLLVNQGLIKFRINLINQITIWLKLFMLSFLHLQLYVNFYVYPGLLALAVCVDTMVEILRTSLFRLGIDKIKTT